MVGGDSASESEVSRAEGQLRRTNLFGCGSPKSSHARTRLGKPSRAGRTRARGGARSLENGEGRSNK